MIHFDEGKQKHRLDELLAREAEEFAQNISAQTGLQYADLSRVSINTDALRLIPEATAREAKMAAFHLSGNKLQVAILSPNNKKVEKIVNDLRVKYDVVLMICSEQSLKRAWERYGEISMASASKAGEIAVSNEQVADLVSRATDLSAVKKMVEETVSDRQKISDVLEIIMAGAISTRASDIHIEPEETQVRIRFRLDGVLTDVAFFANDIFRLLMSRIKLVSSLKLNVASMRQDGRFSIRLGEKSIEVRVSIIPGGYGESVVMRVLDPDSIKVTIDKIGVETKLFEVITAMIKKPNGMILTTGPTGSGKTTTLYAFLRTINDPGSKIITIEDPIEYHLEGITQTQVEAGRGYTFNEGLKSAMRQDPDIIMVGEIRDKETAATAIDAALTGHLVFSTLHTNSAAGAIPRLIDLGVNPKVIGPAVNLALAQRLVRTLCQKCKKGLPLNPREEKIVKTIVDSLRAKGRVVPEELKLFKGVGCNECHKSGYTGRIGIFEGILIDEAVERVIVENPSEYDIARAAAPQGLLTMREDGILKVLEGKTSFEELERVVDLE